MNYFEQTTSYIWELVLIQQKKEVSENKKKSRKIYRAIAQISPLDGYILEAHMMEKELVV